MIDFGHGVKLARIEYADLPKLREWRNHWDIWRWCRQEDLIHPARHDEWWDWQAKDDHTSMFKVVSGTGQIVGVCGLTSIDHFHRRAEFSCYIGPEHQRHGYATQALKTLFTHGFKNLNLNLIWGETFDGNPAAKVFEKIGMKLDGTRREFYWKAGQYLPAHLYSVLAWEWKP